MLFTIWCGPSSILIPRLHWPRFACTTELQQLMCMTHTVWIKAWSHLSYERPRQAAIGCDSTIEQSYDARRFLSHSQECLRIADYLGLRFGYDSKTVVYLLRQSYNWRTSGVRLTYNWPRFRYSKTVVQLLYNCCTTVVRLLYDCLRVLYNSFKNINPKPSFAFISFFKLHF